MTISWSYRPVISLALPSGWSHPDAALEAPRFLEILAALVQHEAGVTPAMIVAVTIRADRYEPLQTAPGLAAKRVCLRSADRHG